jgi:hypothetical protein
MMMNNDDTSPPPETSESAVSVSVAECESAAREEDKQDNTTCVVDTDLIKHMIRNLGEALKCPLCLKMMQEPVCLAQCMHAFCKECIKGSFLKTGKNECFMCKTAATRRSLLDCPELKKLAAHYKQWQPSFGFPSAEDSAANGEGVIDTRRSAARDDRKPAPKTKTDPPHQDDSPRLPKESKRRASTHPESEPVTKRAKKQHPPRQNYDILRSEHDVAKEDVLEKLLKDTGGITRRGSFLELIGDDLEVLVMLNLAFKKFEKARKLGKVGGFRNLLYFPLEPPGFPFKKKGHDVPQLEKLISGRIQQKLLDMGCEFYC